MDSILNTIKPMLDIPIEHTHFDKDIVPLINSALLTVRQLGVGLPDIPLVITGDSETWTGLFGDSDPELISATKTYIFMKVKVLFDPPSSAYVLTAYKDTILEYECRMNYAAEKEVI